MPRSIRSAAWGTALLALLLGAWFAGPSAQSTPERGVRSIASTSGLAGIDRGLREHEPVREPRSGARAELGATSDADLPYIPGQLIVKFRDGGFATVRSHVADVVGAEDMRRPTWANFEVITIDPAADVEAVASSLETRDDVEYAQPAYKVYPRFRPNDPLYDRQWNFPAIGMEEAWAINQGATSSIVVAVIDSGLAYRNVVLEYTFPSFTEGGRNYPALGRRAVPFAAAPELGGPDRFVAPRDFIWEDVTPVDLDGHGTHVAGTLGQLTNNGVGVAGMAFNVRLMPIKVLRDRWDQILGAPNFATDATVARGIRYAADNGAQVINMSLGRDGAPAPVVADAVRYAVSRGVFVAISGGNDFERGNPVEQIAAIAAEVDGAMSVAAVGRDLSRAYYSSTGSYMEIAAPGGNLRAGGSTSGILQQTLDLDLALTYTDPVAQYAPPRFDAFAYYYFQGTSMAAPHVAGLAALLMSQGITSPAAIEAAIKRFATDVGPPGRDDEYGHGLINPRATLRGLGLVK
jgi:serine protease